MKNFEKKNESNTRSNNNDKKNNKFFIIIIIIIFIIIVYFCVKKKIDSNHIGIEDGEIYDEKSNQWIMENINKIKIKQDNLLKNKN